MGAGYTLNGAILIPDRNHHRKDMTGAFRPEARKFADYWGIPRANIIKIPISKPIRKREDAVLEAIREVRSRYDAPLDTIVFFCHGLRYRVQFGFRLGRRSSLGKLAATIAEVSVGNVVVPLYCCSTAHEKRNNEIATGDGGWADELRDALCKEGAGACRVMGHTTAGHTSRNPHVRFFDGTGMREGGTGGYWVVRPRGPLWRKWARLLRTEYRYQFPFEELEEIRSRL